MALTVLALGLSSCTEECDYTPAQPSAVETNDYYFDAAQPASEVIGLSDTEYTVTVERVNAADEQTIAIYAVADEEIFTIPSTITFAAGETTADIVIGLNENMEPCVAGDKDIFCLIFVPLSLDALKLAVLLDVALGYGEVHGVELILMSRA